MPELPEVETVRRTLEEQAAGKEIIGIEIFMAKIIKMPSIEEFRRQIIDKTIIKVDRRGKYLLVRLSGDMTLVVHLRMTGQLIYCPQEQEIIKHTHIIFNLNNAYHLRYIDQRQFGTLNLAANQEVANLSGIRTLGPEPLEGEFSKEYLDNYLTNKKTKIKALLLDQTFVAGLGNIYADEALFTAGIHPERLAGTLNSSEKSRLYMAIKEVLAEGIKYRGTTLKDYVDAEGKRGGFQNRLKSYGREGKPCVVCGNNIIKKKVGGRSSSYCPNCQS